MAFNRKIMQKLEDACKDNEAMADYMRALVRFEMRNESHYSAEYTKYLKEYSKEEVEQKEAKQ